MSDSGVDFGQNTYEDSIEELMGKVDINPTTSRASEVKGCTGEYGETQAQSYDFHVPKDRRYTGRSNVYTTPRSMYPGVSLGQPEYINTPRISTPHVHWSTLSISSMSTPTSVTWSFANGFECEWLFVVFLQQRIECLRQIGGSVG